ncbi:MAG: helix-turn-helix domain-containing protein [Candidatus Sulfotelmatobacter sp.]
MDPLLTIREVAELLSMTVSQVYSLRKRRFRARHGEEKAIPCVNINGNLRFRVSDIERWVDMLAREDE